jgi:2-polyprenyl-3-methyl-5-hydroxy-6-metoxy-1,4-benzoquinol methylase
MVELFREMIDVYGDEGDPMRRYILNPGLFGLLGNVANRTILDAGCGTGYLCRMLAKQGAQVTGIEPAASFRANTNAKGRMRMRTETIDPNQPAYD